MRVLAFAVRSLVRQPGRTALGIIGIAAVGALLFDMLLLSRGLVVSFRDLLDSVGFDVRVTATDSPLLGGIRLKDATGAGADLRHCRRSPKPCRCEPPPVRSGRPDGRVIGLTLTGMDPGERRPWTMVSGADLGSNLDAARTWW